MAIITTNNQDTFTVGFNRYLHWSAYQQLQSVLEMIIRLVRMYYSLICFKEKIDAGMISTSMNNSLYHTLGLATSNEDDEEEEVMAPLATKPRNKKKSNSIDAVQTLLRRLPELLRPREGGDPKRSIQS